MFLSLFTHHTLAQTDPVIFIPIATGDVTFFIPLGDVPAQPPPPVPPPPAPGPMPMPGDLIEIPGVFERVPTPAAPKFFKRDSSTLQVIEFQNFTDISNTPSAINNAVVQFGTYMVVWEPVQSPVSHYELQRDDHDGNGFVTVQDMLAISYIVKESNLRSNEVVGTALPTFPTWPTYQLPVFDPPLDYSRSLLKGVRSYRVRACDRYGCGAFSPVVDINVIKVLSDGYDFECVQKDERARTSEEPVLLRPTLEDRREIFDLCQQWFRVANQRRLESTTNALLQEQGRLLEEVLIPHEEQLNNALNSVRDALR